MSDVDQLHAAANNPFWSRFGLMGATTPTARSAGESVGSFLQQNASRRGWGSVSVPASETPTGGGGRP